MNEFENFASNMSPLESEAWDWIIRLDADEPLSAREKSKLTDWLARSPAHIEQLRSLNEFWANAVLVELMPHHNASAVKREKPKTSFSFMRPVYAFSLALMLSIAGMAVWLQTPLNDKSTVAASRVTHTYQTMVGEQKTIDLADGSTVLLNADSQLVVSLSKATRDIWLQKGEAHFDVAKDKARPFNVYATNGRVQAVGTAFSVDVADESLEVLVTEGRIKLGFIEPEVANAELGTVFMDGSVANQAYSQKLEDVAYMSAGEYINVDSIADMATARVDVTRQLRHLSPSEISAKEAWKSGEIMFNGESLKEVVKQLKRYNTTDIVITDPSIAELTIGGRFKWNHLDSLMQNLELNFNLEVRKTDDGKLVISRKT